MRDCVRIGVTAFAVPTRDAAGHAAGFALNTLSRHAFCNVVNREGSCLGRLTFTERMFAYPATAAHEQVTPSAPSSAPGAPIHPSPDLAAPLAPRSPGSPAASRHAAPPPRTGPAARKHAPIHRSHPAEGLHADVARTPSAPAPRRRIPLPACFCTPESALTFRSTGNVILGVAISGAASGIDSEFENTNGSPYTIGCVKAAGNAAVVNV